MICPKKLKFPVAAHHRIIVDAAKRDDETAKGLFAAFDLVEPFGGLMLCDVMQRVGRVIHE